MKEAMIIRDAEFINKINDCQGTTMHPRRHLKKKGSMVKTCQNINVHVVNTDMC